jgi:Mg-chelatase subunit ChlD
VDFVLVIDQSGSMKKSQTHSSESAMDGVKALAKEVVDLFSMGSTNLAARFSVVSFNETARIRVTWSTEEGNIDAAIDVILSDGDTSISAGLNLAGELFEHARDNATKVVLLFSDGMQDESLGGSAAAIDAADLLKDDGAKVFAWGFGDVSIGTLKAIASDESKAQFRDDAFQLAEYLISLEADVCNESPPSSPPSPPQLVVA